MRCPSGKNYAVNYAVLQGQEIFLFPQGSRPTLGTTHVPVQRVPGALSWVQRGWDVKPTTDIHLVSWAKTCDATPHCIHMTWMLAQIYICLAKFLKNLLPSFSGKKRLLSWRRMQEDPPKCRYLSTKLCLVTSREVVIVTKLQVHAFHRNYTSDLTHHISLD